MDVQHIRLFSHQPIAQTRYVAQSTQPFPADGPIQEIGAALPDPIPQGAVGGNYGDAVSLPGRKFTQLRGDQL